MDWIKTNIADGACGGSKPVTTKKPATTTKKPTTTTKKTTTTTTKKTTTTTKASTTTEDWYNYNYYVSSFKV